MKKNIAIAEKYCKLVKEIFPSLYIVIYVVGSSLQLYCIELLIGKVYQVIIHLPQFKNCKNCTKSGNYVTRVKRLRITQILPEINNVIEIVITLL